MTHVPGFKMTSEKGGKSPTAGRAPSAQRSLDHGRIVALPEETPYLDGVQLGRLEQSFRDWSRCLSRPVLRVSRRRILMIFLLIRYTGAKLNEVQAVNPCEDLDLESRSVRYRRSGSAREGAREVQISAALAEEIGLTLADPDFADFLPALFQVDPGFVRRKFYERAQECGFPKRAGSPEMIRKARAAELMQGNMPLPAVQTMLGHSTPNLTSSYVSFSEEEMQQVTRLFLERESARKTSARNAFFGKITTLERGDIQSRIELLTMGGHSVTTLITNDSLERLALKKGRLVTAEVKAPWVSLQKGEKKPLSTAENIFQGVISRISEGEIAGEYVIRLADGNELCAVVASAAGRSLGLREQDRVWALFSSCAVVLHLD